MWPGATVSGPRFPFKERDFKLVPSVHLFFGLAQLIGACMCMWTRLSFCNLWQYNRGINDIMSCVPLPLTSLSLFPLHPFNLVTGLAIVSSSALRPFIPSPFFPPPVFSPTAKSSIPHLARMLPLCSLCVRQGGWRRNLISKSGNKLPLQLKGRPSVFCLCL